jgi:hypothetical protein
LERVKMDPNKDGDMVGKAYGAGGGFTGGYEPTGGSGTYRLGDGPVVWSGRAGSGSGGGYDVCAPKVIIGNVSLTQAEYLLYTKLVAIEEMLPTPSPPPDTGA